MGFTQNIDIIYSKRQRQQIEKQREREKKEEIKNYKRDLKLSLLTDLENEFIKLFEIKGSQSIYYFYDLENRRNIINLIGSSEEGKKYIDNNYYKILNKIYKQFQNHEKAKQINNIKYQQNTSDQKTKNKSIIIILYILNIIKKLIYFVIGFIIFILAVIFGLATKSK
jgi:hypothetical protein